MLPELDGHRIGLPERQVESFLQGMGGEGHGELSLARDRRGTQPLKIQLTRDQWIPHGDRRSLSPRFRSRGSSRILVRVVYPLSTFNYATDGDGVVVSAPAKPSKGSDARVGDRA